jgi:hypothetical protein
VIEFALGTLIGLALNFLFPHNRLRGWGVELHHWLRRPTVRCRWKCSGCGLIEAWALKGAAPPSVCTYCGSTQWNTDRELEV